MEAELENKVLQWKAKIEREDREEKLLRYLQKLQSVHISVQLLMSTGIGKVINKLRKKDGVIGSQARKLVSQWKEVVSSQRSVDETKSSPNNPYLSSSGVKSADNDYDPGNSYEDYSKYRKKAKVDDTVDYDDSKNDLNKREKQFSDYKQRSKHETVEADKKQSHSSVKDNVNRNDHEKMIRSKSSPQKRDKKVIKKLKDKEDFDSTTASFEACLGFNDVIKNKKRRASPSSFKSASKSVSSNVNDSSRTEKTSAKAKDKNSKKPVDRFESLVEATSAKKVKVKDVDILKTLPEIQPNYKPTPQIELLNGQTNKRNSAAPLDDDSYLNNRATNRTKLYSGRANNFVPELLSLQDCCIRVLTDNVDSIRYLGNVPYFIIKSVLDNCTAEQLYAIEYFNPYLVDETDELWELLSGKEFRGKARDEMESWREMYLRLCDEREAKLKAITANISASMAKATPVRQTKLAYVDTVAKPPRDVARRQARQGTGIPVGMPMKSGPPGQATQRPKIHSVNTPAPTSSSNNSHKKMKSVAPLMQKTLKLMKNRFRR